MDFRTCNGKTIHIHDIACKLPKNRLVKEVCENIGHSITAYSVDFRFDYSWTRNFDVADRHLTPEKFVTRRYYEKYMEDLAKAAAKEDCFITPEVRMAYILGHYGDQYSSLFPNTELWNDGKELQFPIYYCSEFSFSLCSLASAILFAVLCENLPNETDLYIALDRWPTTIWFEGISKEFMKLFSDTLRRAVEVDFAPLNENMFLKCSVMRVDLPDKENQEAKDHYGNIIHPGDLCISPQGSNSRGSWVNSFIVSYIQKNNLFVEEGKDDGYHSYYKADRCILLRSKSGEKMTYGKFDWETKDESTVD